MDNILSNSLKATKDFLDSPEGEKISNEYFKKHKFEQKLNKRNLKKLSKLPILDLYHFIEKCIEKYSSDKYIDREYKLGVEPRRELYWILYSYFEKYATKTIEGKYISHFNSFYYVLHNKYACRVINGQGSVCQMFKL